MGWKYQSSVGSIEILLDRQKLISEYGKKKGLKLNLLTREFHRGQFWDNFFHFFIKYLPDLCQHS